MLKEEIEELKGSVENMEKQVHEQSLALEMLSELKKRNIKIAVLSNKPHERTLDNVNAIFGENYFDKVYGERENVKIKPDPEGALLIAKELGVSPEECLYFGDTNTDMKTGNFGVKAIT